MNLLPPISLSHSLKTSRYRFRFLFPGHFSPPSALHLLTAANSCRGPPAASLAPTDFKRLFSSPHGTTSSSGKSTAPTQECAASPSRSKHRDWNAVRTTPPQDSGKRRQKRRKIDVWTYKIKACRHKLHSNVKD